MNVIELAKQAGFVSAEYWPDDFKGLHGCVERFAQLVRNAALEEAAVVCEAVGQEANLAWRSAYLTLDQGIERGADDCADTIRKLKETK